MKKFTLLSLLVVVAIVTLAGCNTARGVGKDMKDTGKHIENIGK